MKDSYFAVSQPFSNPSPGGRAAHQNWSHRVHSKTGVEYQPSADPNHQPPSCPGLYWICTPRVAACQRKYTIITHRFLVPLLQPTVTHQKFCSTNNHHAASQLSVCETASPTSERDINFKSKMALFLKASLKSVSAVLFPILPSVFQIGYYREEKNECTIYVHTW